MLRHGRTTRDQFATATDRLAQVDAHLVGVVLNMVPSSKAVVGYSYGGYESPRSGKRKGPGWRRES